MPTGPRARDEVIAILVETFRREGVDAATLTVVSADTGLGRSSLYHHFPGGKTDMVNAVCGFVEELLRERVVAPLRDEAVAPGARLERMVDTLTTFYDHGRKRCVVERLCSGHGADPRLSGVVSDWIDALARTWRDLGVPDAEALDRAEETVIAVQGALVLCAILESVEPFQRLRRRLLGELERVAAPTNGCGSRGR